MLNIYREEILDHYRNPRNFGRLKNPDYSAALDNPLCGDRMTLYLKVKEGKVVEIKFKGEGCAISRASSSMLTEKIIGMDLKKLRELESEDILDMLGVKISPARLKCALLPLETLHKAISDD